MASGSTTLVADRPRDRRGDRCWPPAPTSTPRPALSPDGRRLAWLRWRPPEHALGRHGAVAGRPRRRTARSVRRAWSPAAPATGSASRAGRPGRAPFRRRARRLDEPLPPRATTARPSASADGRRVRPAGVGSSGTATYDFLPDGSIVAVGAPRRPRRAVRIVAARRRRRRSSRRTPRSWSSPSTASGVVVRAAARREPVQLVEVDLAMGARVVIRRATPFQSDPAVASSPSTSSSRRPAAEPPTPTSTARRTPTSRGPRASCRRSSSPRTAARRRAPSAAGDRRPDVHEPRLSRWSTSTTAAASGTAVRTASASAASGGSSTSTTASRRARWLAERGIVDPKRLAIRGGSASGFTTLVALAFRDQFDAGVELLRDRRPRARSSRTPTSSSRGTTERLVGPWPARAAALPRSLAGLHADRIRVPVLVLQGAEDQVVPAAEAEQIVDRAGRAQRARTPTLCPGRGPRLPRSRRVLRSFEAELSFYAQVFGFEPADPIETARDHVPRCLARTPS